MQPERKYSTSFENTLWSFPNGLEPVWFALPDGDNNQDLLGLVFELSRAKEDSRQFAFA